MIANTMTLESEEEEEEETHQVTQEEEIEETSQDSTDYKVLGRVNTPHDVKKLSSRELELLCNDIRQFLISNLSQTGGHLAPNLGIVETTVAINKVFSLPRDEVVFDVGHQAYVHKILTGRKSEFESLRQYKGLSGFTHIEESVYDLFTTGHGGTSISSAIGKAIARDQKGRNSHVLAIIGDGALTEGMALEALNHAGHLQSRVIIILNDNGMSIAPNVGGFSRYFDKVRDEPHIRSSKEYLKHLVKEIPQVGDQIYQLMSTMKNSFKYLWTPGIIFEELGIRYFGPIDGHDLEGLINIFEEIKHHDRPVLLHVRTTKGKGFKAAEDKSVKGAKWHGGGPFCPMKQEFLKSSSALLTYSKVFGEHLSDLADQDDKVTAITAAMPDGTGLTTFRDRHPDKFFDVAMAEQHAVTTGAGIASSGLKPFVAIYSTFLQRGYDQIVHDVCLQNLPVRFCMDRSGLVGADGPTHHGVFDIAYLRPLHNLTLMVPRDENQFARMLNTMKDLDNGPSAIRYPRGAGNGSEFKGETSRIEVGKAEVLQDGSDLTLFALGTMVKQATEIAPILKEEGISCRVVDARFVKPLDGACLEESVNKSPYIVTLEEGVLQGGFGSAVLEYLEDNNLKYHLKRVGIADAFVPHGAVDKLYKQLKLDSKSLKESILNWYRSHKQ